MRGASADLRFEKEHRQSLLFFCKIAEPGLNPRPRQPHPLSSSIATAVRTRSALLSSALSLSRLFLLEHFFIHFARSVRA